MVHILSNVLEKCLFSSLHSREMLFWIWIVLISKLQQQQPKNATCPLPWLCPSFVLLPNGLEKLLVGGAAAFDSCWPTAVVVGHRSWRWFWWGHSIQVDYSRVTSEKKKAQNEVRFALFYTIVQPGESRNEFSTKLFAEVGNSAYKYKYLLLLDKPAIAGSSFVNFFPQHLWTLLVGWQPLL